MQEPNIEQSFEDYLTRVKLNRNDMPKIQYTMMKRSFMAGCAQLFVLLTNDIYFLQENDAVEYIDKLDKQIKNFWNKQV